MIYVRCSYCEKSCSVPQLHAWALGDPLCSEACARAHPVPAAPSVDRALRQAKSSVRQLQQRVAEAVPLAQSAESQELASARMSSGVGFGASLLMGGVLGAVLNSNSEDAASAASTDRLTTALFDLDQSTEKLLRRIMVLEGLGVSVAGHAVPLVTEFGGLSSVSSPAGLGQVLRRLAQFLAWFEGGLQTLPVTATVAQRSETTETETDIGSACSGRAPL